MEGPSLVILCEELRGFVNKKIADVGGNSKQDILKLYGKKVNAIKSWGKHLIIQAGDIALRIHFLLYGSYRINEERKDIAPRLSLAFKNGEVNFYNCSVKFIEGAVDTVYNWSTDIMSPEWDEKLVIKKIKQEKESMVCDVLMNQDIFTGVGNIIKNEVLFNLHLHPDALVKNLSANQIKALAEEARSYSFKFYEWKRIYELRKHYQVYQKRICPRCEIPLLIVKTGLKQRRSYFCTNCQWKYED